MTQDKTKERARAYYQANAEKCKAQARAWRLANPDRYRELQRAASARRRAQRKTPASDVVNS